MEVTTALVFMGVPSAVTGLCFWLIQRKINIRDKKLDAKDAACKQNELLLIKSIGASMALGKATACAIRDGNCNGEIDSALERVGKVEQEQRDFLTEQGVNHLF